MLKITDLSLRRGSHLLLENVELDVFPGQRMGLTGANGSGKSSLFAVIAGRLEADQGSVTLPRDTLITEVLQETPNSTAPPSTMLLMATDLTGPLNSRLHRRRSTTMAPY